jgi:GWxTD domain-containing protein
MIVTTERFHPNLSLFIVLLLSSSLFAQRERPAQQQDRPQMIFLATENLPTLSPEFTRIDVSYGIPNNFFVFVRNLVASGTEPFTAHGEITVELLDSNNASVVRDFIRKEIAATDPPGPRNEMDIQTGVFSFNVRPGIYFLVFEVKDTESKRVHRNELKKINVKDFRNTTMEISDMIFCESDTTRMPHTLRPFHFGNDIPFGNRADCYVQLRTMRATDSLQITYSIDKFSTEEGVFSPAIKDSLSSSIVSSAHVLRIEKNPAGYFYVESDTLPGNIRSIRFSLPLDTIEQGNYTIELSLRSGTTVKTFKQHFSIRWIGMPFSLRSLPVAISAMEYLLPEEEFRHLKSADAESQKKQFSAFWRKRDNTPGTAFNELMEEYYRRVDYALTAFSTLKEENGIKTERGKAYILYGPPSNIKRKLTAGSAPREIWLYAGLRKILTFVDSSRKGNYKLESSEDIQ